MEEEEEKEEEKEEEWIGGKVATGVALGEGEDGEEEEQEERAGGTAHIPHPPPKTLPQRVREATRPCEIACRRRSKKVVPTCVVFHFKSGTVAAPGEIGARERARADAVPLMSKLALLPGSPSGSGWVVLDEQDEEVDARSPKVEAFVARVVEGLEPWASREFE